MKLSHLLLLLLPFLALTTSVAAQAPAETSAATLDSVLESITEEECYDNVQVLAAKGMGGRGTMTAGFDAAATFIEEQLETLGYTPANGDNFRHPVVLNCVVAGKECHFLVSGLGEEVETLVVERDFVPVIGSRERAASGEAVFIGYAIDSKKNKWSDIKKKDVKGKIVFAFSREPWADNPKSKKFDGIEASRESEVASKAKAVMEAGALALVLIPDPGLVADDALPLPGMVPFVDSRGGGPTAFQRGLNMPDIPVMSVSRAVAGRIFDRDFTKEHANIDKKKKAKAVKAKKGVSLQLAVEWSSDNRQTYNLAALLKGSADTGEVLVVGAHLDHVGYDVMSDNMKLQVYPGADDNASGSASLLEVAQALAGTTPQCDILFLWFTGEELGLLGSNAYCEDPIFPHKNTIAMFNMDMVGRGHRKTINIGGLWDRPGWEDLIKDVHKRIKSPLKMDNKQGRDLYARSDQYSFHQKGVPGLFFFEADLNSNKVYHKPGDVAETIDGKKMESIARLFTACVWAVAHEGARP